MKVCKIGLVLIFLFLIGSLSVQGQNIERVSRMHVLVDIDHTSGLKVGDRMKVLRKLDSSEMQEVGEIKVVMFKGGKTVGKILSEVSPYRIEIGDIVDWMGAKPSVGINRNLLSYLSIGTGLVACGLGYYFYDQADQYYNDYGFATTIQEKKRLQDKTVTYDNRSNFSFGVGGGLLAFGVIYYILNHRIESKPPPTEEEIPLSLYPIHKKGLTGIGLQLSFNPPQKR